MHVFMVGGDWVGPSLWQAAAECKQLQMEVNGQAEVLKQVQLERDTVVAALEKPRHGYQTSSQGDFSELEQKNRELKAVIQEMRKEMEQCVRASDAPMRASHAPLGVMDAPCTAEYVGYLEKELAEVKAEKRKMADHLEELGAHRKPPTPPPPPPPPPSQSPARTSSSDWRHRTHLIALSDTIATLQREKCALELEVIRLKGREEQLLGVARLCQEEVGTCMCYVHSTPHSYIGMYTYSHTHIHNTFTTICSVLHNTLDLVHIKHAHGCVYSIAP